MGNFCISFDPTEFQEAISLKIQYFSLMNTVSTLFLSKSICGIVNFTEKLSTEKAKPFARRGRKAADLSRDG